jgi:hypothetical protein
MRQGELETAVVCYNYIGNISATGKILKLKYNFIGGFGDYFITCRRKVKWLKDLLGKKSDLIRRV